MATTWRRTWHGDEIIARARRASGRAVIGMAEQVSVAQKRAAHEISGDLKRTIHAAQPNTMGEIGADQRTVRIGPTMLVEVGSWLPYACVENNRGGEHRFADIGWEAARPAFGRTLQRAWREEGL